MRMSMTVLVLLFLIAACHSPSPDEPQGAGTTQADAASGSEQSGELPADDDSNLAGGTRPADSEAPPGARDPRPQGEDCGGIAGFVCQEGLFCEYPPQANCGAADQMGVCKQVPDMCTQQYEPVCGCDGKTYSNACAAASASVSVASEGPCGS